MLRSRIPLLEMHFSAHLFSIQQLRIPSEQYDTLFEVCCHLETELSSSSKKKHLQTDQLTTTTPASTTSTETHIVMTTTTAIEETTTTRVVVPRTQLTTTLQNLSTTTNATIVDDNDFISSPLFIAILLFMAYLVLVWTIACTRIDCIRFVFDSMLFTVLLSTDEGLARANSTCRRHHLTPNHISCLTGVIVIITAYTIRNCIQNGEECRSIARPELEHTCEQQ